MTRPFYAPYCGLETKCRGTWPRTQFTGEQFKCHACGWVSNFDKEFIEQYKVKKVELEANLTPEERRQRIIIESM